MNKIGNKQMVFSGPHSPHKYEGKENTYGKENCLFGSDSGNSRIGKRDGGTESSKSNVQLLHSTMSTTTRSVCSESLTSWRVRC